MRIEKIEASNFRTLESNDIFFRSRYCTISGHNNAGKSSIIRMIQILLGEENYTPWSVQISSFSYDIDKTKWSKPGEEVRICCSIVLSKEEDPALISFMERLLSKSFADEEVILKISVIVGKDNEKIVHLKINGDEIEGLKAQDIISKIRTMDALIVYNSTSNDNEIYVRRGRAVYAYELSLSDADHRGFLKLRQNCRSKSRKQQNPIQVN